jgi:hypothetical protein
MRGLTTWNNETSWRHKGAATQSLLNQQPAAAQVLAGMLDQLSSTSAQGRRGPAGSDADAN